MSSAVKSTQFATKRDTLRIHRPDPTPPSSAAWLINGFPATIVIWTAEEWAVLDDRPVDAQPFPNGVWCALRID